MHAFYCLLEASLLQHLHRQAQETGPGLTMEGLKHGLGQLQRIDLLYPRQGEERPPQAATANSKQALAEKLHLDEFLASP